MKKLVVLAVASMIGASAMAGEMKWSGSAGWRYDQTTYNDSLESKNNTTQADVSKQMNKNQKIRANLGAMGGWDHVEWGVGVRTTGAANDDWANFGNTTGGNAATANVNGVGQVDNGIGLEQAWFRYVRDFDPVDFSVTIGKQKPVFMSDASGNFIDSDVRFTGLGWNFKFGMFGLNAAQYTTGAVSAGTQGNSAQTYTDHSDKSPTTQSKFNMLMAFQPYMNWKFSDEIETMFALGYYLWNDASNTNGSAGGYNSATLNTGATQTPIAQYQYRIHNPKQWQIYNTWTLPWNLAASLEFVKNKKGVINNKSVIGYAINAANPEPEVSSSAWSAGITYGKINKAHDFSVGYAYGKKGLGSVIDIYSSETILPDNKGHTLMASYALADNFVLSWTGVFLREHEKVDGSNGKSYGVSNNNKTKQEQKMKYWEVAAAVSF